jgi:hypothetical protein
MAFLTEKVTEFFTTQLQREGSMLSSLEARLRDIENIFSEDVAFHFCGQGSKLAVDAQGRDAFKTFIATRLIPCYNSIYDPDRPISTELVRVIGGGESPYVAVEFKGTGTSKGESFLLKKVSPEVYLMSLNRQ